MCFRELMDELAEKANVVGGIELDGENRCFMEFDDLGVVIQGLDEVNLVSFLSAVGEPPPERLEELYRALLEANHLFRWTSGATLSLDPEDGWVYLCKFVPYEALDGERLAKELENFANAVAGWRTYIKDFRASDVRKNADEDDFPGSPFASGDSFLRM